MFSRSSWAVLGFALLAIPAAGEDVFIDLARDQEVVRTVEAGVPLTVVLLNRIPTVKYTVRVERVTIDIAPLPISAIRTRELTPAEVCKALADRAHELRNLSDKEEEVLRLVGTVDALIPAATAAGCEARVIEQAVAAIVSTRQTVGPYVLGLGEELRVTVSRPAAGPPPTTLTWKGVFTTGARGSWTVSYGFAFASDDGERYFSQPTGTGKFKITPEVDRRKLAFMPTVFFSWLSKKQELKDLALNIAGGLGFDQAAPTVFLGPSLTYNRNLMVVGGVSIHRQPRLRGQYQGTGTEEIAENLSADQLHEHTYVPGGFVALTFRFDGNPFKKDEPATPKGGEQPKAPTKVSEPKAPAKDKPASEPSPKPSEG